MPRAELLQGTLDMLVLKALARGRRHGYDIARWIQETSGDALAVEEGSLYPALYRMEKKGWITSSWGLSENNRRARFYELSPLGHRQLDAEHEGWMRLAAAIARVMA